MKYFLNTSYGIDFTKCFPSGHRNCGNYEKIYLTNNLIGDHIYDAIYCIFNIYDAIYCNGIYDAIYCIFMMLFVVYLSCYLL